MIAAMVGIDTRSTMDMDATIKGILLSEDELEKAFNVILTVPIDDGVTMRINGFGNIQAESEYPGIRVSIEAIVDKTKQMMKVDITAGDMITPREVEYYFKLMFEDRRIRILAYNIETVLAEKLETILSRSTTSTRMRDYYDVYILTTPTEQDINWDLFINAFRRTSEKRGSYKLLSEAGQENMMAIESSKVLSKLWDRYQLKNSYSSDLKWEDAVMSVKRLYSKVFSS